VVSDLVTITIETELIKEAPAAAPAKK